MVLLAVCAVGLEDALQVATNPVVSVWCGADAISEANFAVRRIPRLSRFIYPLQGQTREVLEDAPDTIREHHPGEVVWVEGA